MTYSYFDQLTQLAVADAWDDLESRALIQAGIDTPRSLISRQQLMDAIRAFDPKKPGFPPNRWSHTRGRQKPRTYLDAKPPCPKCLDVLPVTGQGTRRLRRYFLCRSCDFRWSVKRG